MMWFRFYFISSLSQSQNSTSNYWTCHMFSSALYFQEYFFSIWRGKSFHLLRAKCSQKRCETFVPMGIDLYLFPFFSWFITASSISLHDWYFSIKIVVVMIRMKITDLGINVRTKFSYINLIKNTAYLLLILFVDWQCSISIALKVKTGVTFSKTFFSLLPH